MRINRRLLRTVLAVVVAVVAFGLNLLWQPPEKHPSIPGAVPTVQEQGQGEEKILQAFGSRRSGLMVEVEGWVERVLADDREGSQHQRFILRLSGGHTVLVAHNVDLADRVPLASRDLVRIHGQYEWNERGGVLHWTHLDPGGRHEGGWIRHRGRLYQ
jgi:hypothetical protein